ncbi:hypothetical protein [Micromonospora tarensis]|uniref:Uncharacterized protein n=1 Tax=Micromonospora tarensis TaxID=2806100 RepID=A0ABS1YH67_9ACTN|nr:hypothetical protein [Micromonospora tarensis]MBM0276759.1 hypothetical protein [Micromonospora tarensis]
MSAIVAFGHFAYSSIPTPRLVAYSLAALVCACVTAVLTGRYLVQKCRRDAWWDGHAACDDPDADSLPLRRIKAELVELTDAVIALADAAGQPRPPQPRAQPAGSTYASRAAQNDTVLLTRHAEPAAAPPVQLAEREPADPIAEARAEGFAEGYVAGIERRMDGTN